MKKKVVLSAKNLCKSFYHPQKMEILKNISLDLHEGEAIAIMGKSGSGKSTLLNILGTLESPCTGSIMIADQKATSSHAPKLRNRHIGFVFQSFNLLEDYTVLENVLMPAKIARKSLNRHCEIYERALHLLDRVCLSDRLNFLAKLLSGGEKQRTAIARALCNDPDIILADEPSGNLDRVNALNIQSLLIETSREFGKSLIVVTHDGELAALCDHTFLLTDGLLHRM